MRKYLAAGGVVAAIATALFILPTSGLNPTSDGGVALDSNCSSVVYSCTAWMPTPVLSTYALATDGGAGGYVSFLARGYSCTDGGVGLPSLASGASLFRTDLCTVVDATCASHPALCGAPVLAVETTVTPVAPPCACSDGSGTCLWTPPLPGGGLGTLSVAPNRVTLPAGSWSGPGCIAKICGNLAGRLDWPAGCP